MRNDKIQNAELKKIVSRLNRIFPQLEMTQGGDYIDNNEDYIPPITVTWYDIVETLKNNGLEITRIIK